MAEDNSLFTASNLAEANALRKHLMESARRLWVFVSANPTPSGGHVVSVANEYGGRLSESMTILLRDDTQRFIDDYRKSKPTELNEDDITEVNELVSLGTMVDPS